MADPEQRPNRLILWAAVLTALMAVVSLAMAVTTLPDSGPYRQSDCVGYPYTDVAALVPRDYLWMFPAVVLNLLVMLLVECVHQQMSPRGELLSRIGVAFTIMGVAILVLDYASQLGFAMLRMPTRLWRAAGWVFAGAGALTLLLLVFDSAFYRVRLDYRFEVTGLAITWLVLIVVPVLLSIALLKAEPVTDQRARRLRGPDRDFVKRYTATVEAV